MTTKKIKEMIEETDKDMASNRKKEIYEGIEKLLGKGFSCIVVATNKGNIVVGHKLNIMSAIGVTLSEMYEKGQLDKSDLDLIVKGAIETAKTVKKQDETKELMRELEESLKKLFD